jgi:hypothetical protein
MNESVIQFLQFIDMSIKFTLSILVGMCLSAFVCNAQSPGVDAGETPALSGAVFSKLRSGLENTDRQLTRRTDRYLQRMIRRERQMQIKLNAVDSVAAKELFSQSAQRYADLNRRMQTDSGGRDIRMSGSYLPYADSIGGALKFLQQDKAGLVKVPPGKVGAAVMQFQSLQAKMQDAEAVKAYMQERKQEISKYISEHAAAGRLLGKQLTGLNQDVYYYSQQLRQYREMWDHPDQIEQKLLGVLQRLPAFQTFMKNNSQLGSLFQLPRDYGTPQGLAGLQTREAVSRGIQEQLSAAGPGAEAKVHDNLQSAQSQLDDYKGKMDWLGDGNGNMDMPDFKPNDQRTKTFWKRLEYGANFQTTRNNYYFPTVSDLGLSLGYKLGQLNVVGIGASYKLGWGNGIQHIALSSQGLGLRSFVDIHIRGSFSASGGLEYNYTTPFNSFQQLRQIERWTQSGLIGVSKTVSMRSRVFRKTKLQLLWDFLSYRQTPRTQPLLFRIGYGF